MASTDSVVAVKQVAVLGTGIMGSAMARNLAAAGMRTVAWDRSRSAVAALAEAGVISAASPDDAVREAQVVITMLPTADVVRSIMLSAGVVSSLAEHAVRAQMGHDRRHRYDSDRRRARQAPRCPGSGRS